MKELWKLLRLVFSYGLRVLSQLNSLIYGCQSTETHKHTQHSLSLCLCYNNPTNRFAKDWNTREKTTHNTTIFMLSRSAFGFRSISKLVLAVCCATRWLILKLKFYLLLHKIQILFHSWLLMFGCCCCYCCISFLLVFSISFGAVMVVESKLALFFHSVLFFLFSVHTELICIYECKTVYRFAFICRWRIAIRNWKANREYQCIVFAVKRDMWSPCFVVDVCRRFFSDIVISLLNCLCFF